MTRLHPRIALLCLLCACASHASPQTLDVEAFKALYRNLPNCERVYGVDPDCLISSAVPPFERFILSPTDFVVGAAVPGRHLSA
jgi:hypothetical protein